MAASPCPCHVPGDVCETLNCPTHTNIHTNTHVRTYIHIHTQTFTYMHKNTLQHTQTYTNIHKLTWALLCVCVCAPIVLRGFYNPDSKPVPLTRKSVDGIQLQGGTILGTSRGGANLRSAVLSVVVWLVCVYIAAGPTSGQQFSVVVWLCVCTCVYKCVCARIYIYIYILYHLLYLYDSGQPQVSSEM